MCAANDGARCSSAASISIEDTAMKRPELMNLSTKARRLLRTTALAGALAPWAAASHGRRTASRPTAPSSAMRSCIQLVVAARCPWAARQACVRSESVRAGTAT